MYSMFLDDLRIASKHYKNGNEMITVRSYAEAVQCVYNNGLPSFVSFDHDLGDVDTDNEKTGYDFAKFLIDYMIDNEIKVPFDYFIHSANPVGAENIEKYLRNGFNFITRS